MPRRQNGLSFFATNRVALRVMRSQAEAGPFHDPPNLMLTFLMNPLIQPTKFQPGKCRLAY